MSLDVIHFAFQSSHWIIEQIIEECREPALHPDPSAAFEVTLIAAFIQTAPHISEPCSPVSWFCDHLGRGGDFLLVCFVSFWALLLSNYQMSIPKAHLFLLTGWTGTGLTEHLLNYLPSLNFTKPQILHKFQLKYYVSMPNNGINPPLLNEA